MFAINYVFYLQFMTALIDSDLICHFCASDIPNALQAVNVTYKVVSNVHPFTVTWSRKCQTQLSTIGGQVHNQLYILCYEISSSNVLYFS